MLATVLSIAGSDPTGGAGIQADIKTMTAVGVYAAAVVTCVTVQNSLGVQRVEPLSPDLIADQIKAVLEDHRVTHIKTGMIGTAEISAAIRGALDRFQGELIVDPVLISTTGQELLQPSGIASLKSNLISRATVITPNLPELTALTGTETNTPERILEAADDLLKEFPNLRTVLVKGGHAEKNMDVTDLLLYRSEQSIKLISSTRPLVRTRNTHGTGCALASAYAAYHCLTGDDEQAFFNCTNFIQQALEQCKDLKIVKNRDGFGGFLYRPCKID